MGRLKQLLPLEDKPVIRHCIDTLIASGISDIAVVLSGGADEIVRTIEDLPLKIVFNNDSESEMAESVRVGLCACDVASSGVLISLCDHPLVSPETVKTLVRLHTETPDKIIIPSYRGKKGHPTLFPRNVVEEVFAGVYLKQIISKDLERIISVDVSDEGIILDMDTTEDYGKMRQRAAMLRLS